MQVFNSFQELNIVPENCVIALGTFDGIHLGHIDIINTAKQYAQKNNVKLVVFSFSNHPLDKIAPEKAPLRICSEEKKKELLESLSVDILFNKYFDDDFLSVSSSEFVQNLLKYFSPSCLVIGDNYSYGYLGAGTPKTLVQDGKNNGFKVIVKKLIEKDGIVASSTNIRTYLNDGNILTANDLLGRKYSFVGLVSKGDGRGRKIGFPTANLVLDTKNQLVPAFGVYTAWSKFSGKVYKSVISIGNNPTFDDVKECRVEVHILNFNNSIYGKNIEVFFEDKIRDLEKFSTVSELICAIKQDVDFANENLDSFDIYI